MANQLIINQDFEALDKIKISKLTFYISCIETIMENEFTLALLYQYRNIRRETKLIK
jgi:hypothetical protein